MEIRALRADEIECRVQQVTQKGVRLLLYKDARVDMVILDETFTIFGWKRKHEVINNKEFCTVAIQNPTTKEWIQKQDCGTESNTEKAKGETSDAFKRACFNWGIGRELYTKIFIFIKVDTVKNNQGKFEMGDKYEKFTVSKIETDNKAKKILCLEISNKFGKNIFKWDNGNPPKYEELQKDVEQIVTDEQIKKLFAIATKKKITKKQVDEKILKQFKKPFVEILDIQEYEKVISDLEKIPDEAVKMGYVVKN